MEIVAKAAAEGNLFEPMQVDQPFLNYVFDTLPRQMTHVNTLLPEISLKPWARVPFQLDTAHDRAQDAEGRQMPFVHWAGCHYPTMVRKEVFLHYRTRNMNTMERLWFYQQFFRQRWKKRFGEIVRRRD